MNKGLLHSKGEYLNFMNSGDCYHSQDVLGKNFLTLDADILTGSHPENGIHNVGKECVL